MRVRVSPHVELEYETFGDPAHPPLLLIMGLGAQLVHWPLGLCQGLAAQGYWVIRFDNRDAGLSSRLDHLGLPRIPPLMFSRYVMRKRRVKVPYLLADMVQDTLGLLDALSLPAAHVVGISMGGMLAQLMALAAPKRVLSLTSMSSAPGSFFLSRPRALASLLRPAAPSEKGAVERSLRLFQALRGDRYPPNHEALLALALETYRRGQNPHGFSRQLAAVVGTPSWRKELRHLEVPALVTHGTRDPLIPVSAGKATAKAIPNSRLHLIEGLGHHLPQGVWAELIETISSHAHSSQSSRPGRAAAVAQGPVAEPSGAAPLPARS